MREIIIKKEIEISKIKFACFKGKVKVKLRGTKVDEISNIARDIYNLDIYESEITETKPIDKQEFNKFKDLEEMLVPELIEALVEKPRNQKEKQFYVEDVRNCIIHNYEVESFKQERTSYAIIRGEIVFQIEYRVKEKVLIDVPASEVFTINAGKIKIKRVAVTNTPKESGENLILAGLVLGIFQFVGLLALILTLVFAFRDYWQAGLWLVGVFAFMWFVGYFGKYLFKIVSTLISWVVAMLIMGFLLTWLSLNDNKTEKESKSSEKKYEDINVSDSITYESEQLALEDTLAIDSILPKKIYNSLHWSDYSGQRYSFEYLIDSAKFLKARQNRSKFVGYTWQDIYENLYRNDKSLLKNIFEKYDSLRFGVNSLDFARVIVSSIQEIPYTWILPESCLNAPNQQEINQSGYACLGNVKNYGVQSPIEFMANQKGDCDTKALIIYSVLKHFNYDVCILTSMAYEHALIGINIPANGKFKNHRGKKYYVWETTVKGIDIGQLPPTHSNMNLWEVTL